MRTKFGLMFVGVLLGCEGRIASLPGAEGSEVEVPTGGSERRGVGLSTDALEASPLDQRRSLAVTDTAILQSFTLERVLGQIGAPTGQPATALFTQLWDTQNPPPGLSGQGGPLCLGEVNGFPLSCRPQEGALAAPGGAAAALAGFSAVGLFNRFDLAPTDGANCGEYRIVFALRPPAMGRAFVIFEAVLPNPNPERGLEGCRPVVNLWRDLSAQRSLSARAAALDSFYFQGLPGFEPVVQAEHYAVGGGQVRLNLFVLPRWELRELRVARACSSAGCPVQFVPDSVKTNPFGGLFDETVADPRGSSFRSEFLGQVATLARNDVNTFNMAVSNTFNAATSDAQSFGGPDDYLAQFGRSPNFRSQLQGELNRLGSALSPEDVVGRAQALSCGGCHQRSAGRSLGGGLSFPFSAGFVHATEFTEAGPDGPRFGLSSALENTFLPFRAGVMSAFLARADRDSDGDGVFDHLDNCLNTPNPDQHDADADGFGDRCDGDANNDDIVNALDLGLLRAAFGTFTNGPADLNGDGVVNSLDLGILRLTFGTHPGPSAFH